MAKIKFTKRALDALAPAPPGRRIAYYAEGIKGLMVQVTDKGAKSFYLYRKVRGRPERMHLGTWPELSILEAEAKAQEMNGLIATRQDPRQAGGPRRGEWTLGDLWTWYLEAHARPHKKTWKSDALNYQRHLSAWAERRLSDFARADVRAHQAHVAADAGPDMANKVIGLLRIMFKLAESHELHDGPNPAAGIPAYRGKKRDRRLTPAELPRFLAAVAAYPDELTRDWIMMAFTTGARIGNVRAMRWDQLDLAGGFWHIPETKNGKPLVVPLEPEEVAMLARRQKAVKGPWVFPSPRPGAVGHLLDGGKQWAHVLDAAAIEDFRIHDLRRTHASVLADAGTSLPIIGRSLGHIDPQSTAIYARPDLGPVREAKRRLMDELAAAAKKG